MSAHYGKAEEVKYDQLKLASNPRSIESISQESIRELGESVFERGITDRLRIRVAPDGSLQVWDGQRRFMGIGWAMELESMGRETSVDLSMVPVINDGLMTDAEMLERQMHGFVQREELTPLDEAKGFERLRIEFGRTAAEISRAIGRNQDFVAGRLGLLRVPERAWKAYAAHRLTIPHLALIGSVPLEADREQFTKEILAGEEGLPLTLVQARELKARAYGVALNNPKPLFDRDDPKLVPLQWKGEDRVGGGACNAECPFYGGSDKNPMCGNVGCYDKKQRLAWSALKSNAIDNSKRWMDVDASSQLFTKGPKLELGENCGFIDLAARLGFMDTGNYDTKHPVWSDLLEDTDGSKKSITTLHPNGKKVYQLLEREEAIKLAVERDPAKEALFAKRPGAPKKVEPVDSGTVGQADSGTVGQSDSGTGTREPVEQSASGTVATAASEAAQAQNAKAALIATEQQRVMTAMHAAWSESHPVCNSVEQMLVESRLEILPAMALKLICTTLCDETAEVIAQWSNDACVRMLVQTGEEPAYLMMLAEMALILVRNNGSTAELLELIAEVIEDPKEEALESEDEDSFPELQTPPVPDSAFPILGDRLKAHLVSSRAFVEWKDISAKRWLTDLVAEPVPQSLPNAHGVMVKTMEPEQLRWKGGKKHDWLNVRLAYHYEQRTWHFGVDLHEGTQGGGSPACADEGYVTRVNAVIAALRYLVERATRPGEETKSKAVVEQMLAVMSEAFVEAKETEMVVLDAKTTVEEWAEKRLEPEQVEALLKPTSDEVLETIQEPLSDREKAWVLFAKGMGKGAIAKELGIPENTVGTWQKRIWPSRGDLKRYEESNTTGDPIDMSLEAVTAWVAANPPW